MIHLVYTAIILTSMSSVCRTPVCYASFLLFNAHYLSDSLTAIIAPNEKPRNTNFHSTGSVRPQYNHQPRIAPKQARINTERNISIESASQFYQLYHTPASRTAPEHAHYPLDVPQHGLVGSLRSGHQTDWQPFLTQTKTSSLRPALLLNLTEGAQ